MKSLVFCCVFVNCFVLGLCDVPQCFKLKFGEISCNQAVDVNTVIKTVPVQNECLSMAKGLELFENFGKRIGKKFEQLYNEEKQKIAILNNQISDTTKEMKTYIDFMKMKMRESAVVVQKDYSTTQLKKCGVGMQDINKIKDNQITGSSMTDLKHRPQYGRLFETRGIKAWSTQPGPGYRETIDKWSTFGLKNQWITVDLKKDTKIIGVVTAGRPPLPLSPTYRLYHQQWVKTFSMEYKTDKGNKLNSFLDPTGKMEVFQGNTDMTTPVVNIFRFPITARWFTIRPIDYNNWMSMQFDLLVC